MELKINRTRKILSEGGTCFGTLLRLASAPEVIALCARSGWDFVIADTEHYPFDTGTLSRLAIVSHYEPITLLVRVQDKHYFQMASTLDLGVEGLVLPRVESRQETERILESTRYHPLGNKGVSVSSAATASHSCNLKEYLEWHNRNVMTVVQIESEEGVERADEIVGPEGVDAVMIGPADLSTSLGIPGEFSHPKMEAAYQKVIDSCNRRGVAPGSHFSNLELARKWMARGMRFVAYQWDARFLQTAFEDAVKGLRD